MQSRERSADVLITGMGFCLPSGGPRPVTDVPEFWDVVSHGRICMPSDLSFGVVDGVLDLVGERVPEIPESHLTRYSDVHLYGILSMVSALEDAGLDWRSGQAANSAVITGRSGVDTVVNAYRDLLDRPLSELSARDAKHLFLRLALSGTVTDITNVQSSLLGSTGPSYTVSCGCASSAVAMGRAHEAIASGAAELAIVTGVDAWDIDQARQLDEVRKIMAPEVRSSSFAEPTLHLDGRMKPYDARSTGFNMGDGSATVVLESKAHAERRGAVPRALLLGQRTRRADGHSALATMGLDRALVQASRDVMALARDEVPGYVNGGAQGDVQFNEIESAAFAELFPDSRPLVSCQEACFGHVASALGVVGAAVSALAVDREVVPPTAGCEEPAPGLGFDPVPGSVPRQTPGLRTALSINYQVGGVASAVLVGAAR